MEQILRRALTYWRSKGFNARVYMTQYSLGPAQFWLCTELDTFGDFDHWPAMATGDAEGREIMDELIRMGRDFKASVVKELDT
jgi:hypothetical protein